MFTGLTSIKDQILTENAILLKRFKEMKYKLNLSYITHFILSVTILLSFYASHTLLKIDIF